MWGFDVIRKIRRAVDRIAEHRFLRNPKLIGRSRGMNAERERVGERRTDGGFSVGIAVVTLGLFQQQGKLFAEGGVGDFHEIFQGGQLQAQLFHFPAQLFQLPRKGSGAGERTGNGDLQRVLPQIFTHFPTFPAAPRDLHNGHVCPDIVGISVKVYPPAPVCQEKPDNNKAVDKVPGEDYFKP
jgi:hypothetical protein